MHTTGFQGIRTKSITVETNDPDRPALGLTFSVNVMTPVEVYPGFFVSLSGVIGGKIEQTLVLRRSDGKPLKVQDIQNPAPQVKVEIEPVDAKNADPPSPDPRAARSGDVRLRFRLAGDLKPGSINNRILIHTNHPEKPEIALPFNVYVQPAIRPVPDRLVLQAGTAATPGVVRVTLLSGAQKKFGLKSVTLAGNWPGAETKPLTPGPNTAQVVEVRLGAGLAPGVYTTVLVAETDLPEAPRVEVPVEFRVPAAPAPLPAAVHPGAGSSPQTPKAGGH